MHNPVSQEPVAQELVVLKPVVQELVVHKPVVLKLVAHKPVVHKPVMHKKARADAFLLLVAMSHTTYAFCTGAVSVRLGVAKPD